MELLLLAGVVVDAVVVVVVGAAFEVCWGDTAVAGDGLGKATDDGDGGSSTRCRLRGRESSVRV